MSVTDEDLQGQPLHDLFDAYRAERGQVKAPPGWRDDLNAAEGR